MENWDTNEWQGRSLKQVEENYDIVTIIIYSFILFIVSTLIYKLLQ